MKRADMTIVIALLGIGMIAVFWFVLLAPKREEAAALGDEIAQLQESVATAEDQAVFAEAAKADYDENYHSLVVLGQAVPDDSDSPSLLVELQKLADDSKISFDSLVLAQSSQGEEPAPATPAAPTPPAGGTPPAEGGTGGAGAQGGAAPEGGAAPPAGGAPAAPAANATQEPAAAPGAAPPAAGAAAPVATEATASTLPLGATVGPAGLPAMPYDLKFTGDYFQVADFFKGVDDLVHTADGDVSVDGRLLTVDGFTLTSQASEGTEVGAFDPTPTLSVSLAATTYLTPAEQGLVAGADPAAPAPTAPAAPTPTSTPAPAP